MKALQRILSAVLLLGITVNSYAQDRSLADKAVEDKKFTIVVESVNPRRGGLRPLTSRYTFVVSPDTVVTHLPYFGRAFQAPISVTDGGIRILSTQFSYESVKRKKGGWEITIRTKDQRNYPIIYVTIQQSGSASIRISPVDREPISYTGRLE